MRTIRTLLLIMMAVLLLVASAGQSRRLRRMAADSDRVELHDAPPMIVFTSVVLGGFRGLLADILWLRASLLQEQGRYMELVQLSDWITKLEPGLPEVWAFHAWNMAYNISVMMPKHEDRWRWVQNGISLLRDEGRIYSPGSPKLLFELGWLFQHKIGGRTDAMNLYYKMEWAGRMSKAVGADGFMDYSGVTEDMRKMLSDRYGLDVDRMKEVDARYGPMDWRLAEANAVYWGEAGVRAAGEKGYVACDRLVYQSMMEMFRNGTLDFDFEKGRYEVTWNPGILPGALKAFEDAMRRHPDENTISDSYSIFLREAVRRLHENGLSADARRLFLELAQEHGDRDTAGGYDDFINFKYDAADR